MSEDDVDLEDRWRTYFRDECVDDVKHLVERYPALRSLYVDVIDLHRFDPAFTTMVLDDPDRLLRIGRDVLRTRHDDLDRVHIRLTNHPGLLGIRSIRARHVDELVTVEGVVDETGPVRAAITDAVYGCADCGNVQRSRSDGFHHDPPVRCDGCDDRSVRLLRDRCTLVDDQRLTLVEPAEGSDEARRSIDVHVDDDLVDSVEAGTHVLVTGVVRLDGNGSSNRFDFLLDAVSIDEEPGSRPDDVGELRDVIHSRWELVTRT